jgi:hypothetical protein
VPEKDAAGNGQVQDPGRCPSGHRPGGWLKSNAARSLEGEFGGGIGVDVLQLTQHAHTAWEQLHPAQARRAWNSGHDMDRQQAIKAALADG